MSARVELLLPAEVGVMFKVDPKTVTRWEKAGKLLAIRTAGGVRRYFGSEVRALAAGKPRDAARELALADLEVLKGGTPGG